MEEPLHIFCCYAQEDQPILVQIKKHLKPLEHAGQIVIHSDTDIIAGEEWERKIKYYLNNVRIILLFVSPDFMSSDYYTNKEIAKEMALAIKRHVRREVCVIPIIVRPVRWQSEAFGHLRVLPRDARPIVLWRNRDEAFLDIAEGLRNVIEEIKTQWPLSYPSDQERENDGKKFQHRSIQEQKPLSGNQSHSLNPTLSRILFASFLLLMPIEILLRTFNFSTVIDIVNFGLTIVGLIFAAIQANVLDLQAISLPRINSRWLLFLVCTLLIVSVALNTVLLTSRAIGVDLTSSQHASHMAVATSTVSMTNQRTISMPSPTISSATPTSCPSSASPDAASQLIPCSSPVVDDQMNDAANKNGWQRESQAYGSCDYVTGATTSYHLTAPANLGIGCWTTNQSMVFSSFVYQVKMTIVKGVNNSVSGAGPMFRISSDQGDGYKISFNAMGGWCAFVSSNGSSTPLKCGSDTTNFHTGIGQSNYLTIKAQNKQFDVQVNGHSLCSFTDASYSSGYVGFQLGPGSQDSDIVFSDVKVWQV